MFEQKIKSDGGSLGGILTVAEPCDCYFFQGDIHSIESVFVLMGDTMTFPEILIGLILA